MSVVEALVKHAKDFADYRDLEKNSRGLVKMHEKMALDGKDFHVR